MPLATYAIVLSLAVAIGLLSAWSNNPQASDAQKTVLSTALYSVASGAIVNGICAVMARGTGAVEPGDEMGACSPYGLMGSGIAARLHFYWIDGYGPEEWAYVRSGPAKTAASLRDGLDGALDLVNLDLKKLGLVNADQDM